MRDLRHVAESFCKQVLEGQLDLVRLVEEWPSDAKSDPFLTSVYEDLEEAVEHQPGFWLRKGVNLPLWRKSLEFLKVLLDFHLLSRKEDSISLLRCRQRLIQEPELSQANVKQKIEEFFSAIRARSENAEPVDFREQDDR